METDAQRIRELADGLEAGLSGAPSTDVGGVGDVGRVGGVSDEVGDAAAEAVASLRRLADVLERQPASGGQARLAPVEVVAPVLGVDGCRAGWVGALLEPGAPRPRIVVAPTIADLVAMVRESTGIRVVGIDIPIGLPDSTIRQADVLARQALPGKASSIFTTLTRPAYAAATRLEADAVNRGLVGQGVGAQAFALRDKIVEVDAWLRSRPTVTVLEVHPEVSFATMAGAPITASKKTDGGRDQRLAALAAAGIARPSVLQGQGYAADDVLDACAVAWSAARHAAGLARPLPDPPEVFSDGIPAAIWA
jgi:predicted RNase H-like nuclease